jgi:hypothetical protein
VRHGTALRAGRIAGFAGDAMPAVSVIKSQLLFADPSPAATKAGEEH